LVGGSDNHETAGKEDTKEGYNRSLRAKMSLSDSVYVQKRVLKLSSSR
jgi:hypothetical protein